MNKNIPKLKITIDDEYSEGEDLGVSMVAFTKRPAILVKGMAFNSNAKPQFFSDDLKYRICAPAMIPMEIYRCDDDGEYTVTFSEEEIDKIHSKFMKNYTSTKIFNLEHNAEEVVPAYILETWIVDKPLEDKAFTTFGIEVPKGTLMMTSQITDKDYYNELVKNGQTGYSIEGFLGMKLSEITNKNNINKKEEKMNKQNYEAVKTTTGEIFLDGPIAVDTFVYCQRPSWMLIDGKTSEVRYPLWETVVELEDGTILTLADSKIVLVDTKEVTETSTEETTTDTTTTTDATMAEDVTEDVAEAEDAIVKEEEMAEETPADAAVDTAEEVVDTELPMDSYSKEEVDAKFEELYRLIAKMQAEDDAEDATENDVVEPTQMSVKEKFSAFVEFSKKSL